MSELTIGILGGGQLGSLLCLGARKLNINTVVSVSYTHLRAHETEG